MEPGKVATLPASKRFLTKEAAIMVISVYAVSSWNCPPAPVAGQSSVQLYCGLHCVPLSGACLF